MKKLFIALLAALLLPLSADASLRLRNSADTLLVHGTDSSNASVTAVNAISGREYHVYGAFLSVSTADTVTLKCGSTAKLVAYFGDTSGILHNFYPLGIECAANEALVLTKGTGSTPLAYTLWYTKENAD